MKNPVMARIIFIITFGLCLYAIYNLGNDEKTNKPDDISGDAAIMNGNKAGELQSRQSSDTDSVQAGIAAATGEEKGINPVQSDKEVSDESGGLSAANSENRFSTEPSEQDLGRKMEVRRKISEKIVMENMTRMQFELDRGAAAAKRIRELVSR